MAFRLNVTNLNPPQLLDVQYKKMYRETVAVQQYAFMSDTELLKKFIRCTNLSLLHNGKTLGTVGR